MRRFTFNVFQVRPSVVLVVILTLCMCSVMMSMYYIDSVALAFPLHALGTHRNRQLGSRTIDSDDTWEQWSHSEQQHLVQPSPAFSMNGSAEDALSISNNVINIHAEKKTPKDKAFGTQSPKVMRKEDQWPTHEKLQKKKKAFRPMEVYNNPQRTSKNWNGERYIIYLCHSNLTCAGWGDRQHGIFSAYLLSLVTNRTFKVDMQSPCPLSNLYHPRIVNWKINQSEISGLSSTHLYLLNDRAFREAMKTMNFDEQYPQDIVYLTTNYDYYYNLKANPNYREIFTQKVKGRPRPILFADLWQGIFKMNKRVVAKYSKALSQAYPSKNHKLACAHIRFGRNPTIPNDSDVRNTLTTITPLWKFLNTYSDDKKYRLFIASDWEGFRDKVKSIYKNVSVDVDGDIIHIDKMREHARKDDATIAAAVDPCSGFEKVIADQYVLSKCDILLLTYSVFGKAASYLRRSNSDLYLMDNGTVKALMLFDEKRYSPKRRSQSKGF